MSAATAVVLCACGHPSRAHSDDGCRVPDCMCSDDALSSRDIYPDGPAAKWCGKCREQKPLDDFHRDASAADGRYSWCKPCVTARPYRPSMLKVVKTRAHKRALADLARRHPDEFRTLLREHETAAFAEAERLAAVPVAQSVHEHPGAPAAVPVRLKRGIRAGGETLTDRIDVARCPECIGYHDRGHRCDACGSEPHAHEAAS